MLQSATGLARAVLLAAGLAASASAGAAIPEGPIGAIHAFIDAFNRDDIATAQAANDPDVGIVDEIPPHEWHGPGSFQAWVGDLGKDAKAKGQTDQKVTIGQTVRQVVDGDTAYIVVRVSYTYREHGKAIVEPAQIAAALRNGTGGWKIASWAWAGETPRPAKR
jgi:endonuclease YncB( thermonuclease family)